MTPLRDRIRAAVETAVREAKAPGAVAYVGDVEHTHAHIAVGSRQLVPTPLPAEPDTIYDLASVTKVIATTTAIMLLNESGSVDLDAPVSAYIPFPAFSRFAVKHCLTHTAGLHPGKPFYKDCTTIDAMLERYAEIPLSWPPGTRWRYSDVGFMILGRIVEHVSGKPLDVFCRDRIFTPLTMTHTRYKPPANWAARCAATEQSAWRGKIMLGEVHDENAYAAGGVAGHAGLFGTAPDLAVFVRALLTGKVLKSDTVNRMMRIATIPAWPWQGLGWQVDGWPTKNFGFLPARSSAGHAGWTGTSVWMDRRTGTFAILLSNTCHPSRATRDNETLRRSFYTAIGKIYYPRTCNAHTGLDRLVREDFRELRGKRIGLLTHRAAVDQLGRPTLAVFKLAPDVTIARLYSPEHGISGQTEAGEAVGAQESPVPVISLYGERAAPAPDELRGLDVFVIDLQDVGARYYTYAATMKACLKACAGAHVPVLVLDRPNPAGGIALEGPIATNTESLVCWGAVPARHGMTMGEIATWFLRTELKDSNLTLTISALDSWTPEHLFLDSSLVWVPPSPNIPTPETAIIYAGSCLFEGTNISEGRGTDSPFMLLGAPWFDPDRVLAAIPAEALIGLHLEPAAFTPRSMPGKAVTPKYLDKPCHGVRVLLDDASAARPFTMAVALLSALRKTHGDRFEWNDSFDVLSGSTSLRERIDRGDNPVEIVRDYSAPIAAFDAARPKLYVEPAKS